MADGSRVADLVMVPDCRLGQGGEMVNSLCLGPAPLLLRGLRRRGGASFHAVPRIHTSNLTCQPSNESPGKGIISSRDLLETHKRPHFHTGDELRSLRGRGSGGRGGSCWVE